MSVRILIVDDSKTARTALRHVLASEDGFEVVGETATGEEATAACGRLRPDIVTMDVFLERESGLDVTAHLMAQHPCPILIVTAADSKNPRLVFRALEAGALDVTAKLPHPNHSHYEERRRRLVRLVRTLAGVPVVRRRRGRAAAPALPKAELPTSTKASPAPRLVVIGASTGGPSVVAQLLAELPHPFPLPVAVVQHMMSGFASGHCAWLAEASKHRTILCQERTSLSAGTVYLAPEDAHLQLVSSMHIAPSFEEPRAHQRPSIDTLFESAASHLGARAVGVLLTGMGRDGASGMQALHRAGATTLAQEPSTCAVDSMPRAALGLDAVTRIGAPEELAALVAAACAHDER